MELLANFLIQYPQGHPYYRDAEAALDIDYGAALGIPMDMIDIGFRFKKGRNPTIEELYQEVDYAINECADSAAKAEWGKGTCKHGGAKGGVVVDGRCGKCEKQAPIPQPGLMVLDSLDGVSSQAEVDREFGTATYGTEKTRLLSEFFRRMVAPMEEHSMSLFIVSQVRMNMTATFAAANTKAGGKALDHYSAQVVSLAEIRKIKQTIKGVDRIVGIEVRARCTKNKVGFPLRECTFPIYFGYGVDDLTANLQFLASVDAQEKYFKGESSKRLNPFVKQAKDKFTAEEFHSLRLEVAADVKKEWVKLERDFLPKQSKY